MRNRPRSLANAYQSVDRPSFFVNDKKGKYSEIQDGLTPSNQNSLESRNSNLDSSRRDIHLAMQREMRQDDIFDRDPATAENNKKPEDIEEPETPESDQKLT